MFQLNDLQTGDNLVGELRATEMGQQLVHLKESGLRAIVSAAEVVKTRQLENLERRVSDVETHELANVEGIAAK